MYFGAFEQLAQVFSGSILRMSHYVYQLDLSQSQSENLCRSYADTIISWP